MAALMDIDRLSSLLNEASGAGCRLAWLQDGALLAGARPGEPRFAIDFATEALVRTRAARRPTGVAAAARRVEAHGLAAADPSPGSAEMSANARGRRTGSFALVLEGTLYAASSYKELLLIALQVMERERPGTLDKLSAEGGRTRRSVARQPELLYDKSGLLAHAKEIEGGWWVDTNNNSAIKEKIIKRAAWHAGLHVELRRSP